MHYIEKTLRVSSHKALQAAFRLSESYDRSRRVKAIKKAIAGGKRPYTKRTHDILCECTWNEECNPSLNKFWKYMTTELKWGPDGHLH